MGERDPAKLFIADLQGGGALGVLQIEKLIHLETLTQQPVSKLFDAFYCASVGAILGAGLLTPDPLRPREPRYDAKGLGDIFYRYLPQYLPHSPWHYRLQPFKAFLGRKGLHYDRTVMVETLPDLFGPSVMMTDLLGTIVVPSGVLGAVRPYNFVNFRDGSLPADAIMDQYFGTPQKRDKRLEEMRKTLVVNAILASAAAPTVFSSFENPVTGAHHVDIAAVSSPRHLVDTFFRAAQDKVRRTGPPPHRVSFVQFGTGKNFQNVSHEAYNCASFLGMAIGILPDLLSMQVHQEDIEALEAMCGPENVYILDRPWNQSFGRRDILKADPNQIDRLRDYAREEIQEQADVYDRLAGSLVDNEAVKNQAAILPDAVFVPAVKKAFEKRQAFVPLAQKVTDSTSVLAGPPRQEECIEIVCPVLSGGQDGLQCIQVRIPDLRIPDMGMA